MITIKKIGAFVLLIMLFFSCVKEQQKLYKITAKTNIIDSLLESKADICQKVTPYKEKMLKEINTFISYAPKDLTKTDGVMQSSLGNLLADAFFVKADSLYFAKTGKHIDFVMLNYGGIRAGITKGSVTNKSLFELMPFDNTIVVVEMKADKIKDLVTYFKVNQKAHPISKQVKIVLQEKKHSLFIKGKKLHPNKTYRVATSNYLQAGGDKMYFFANPVSVFETNYLIRNAFISYFKSQDTLVAKLDDRVRIID